MQTAVSPSTPPPRPNGYPGFPAVWSSGFSGSRVLLLLCRAGLIALSVPRCAHMRWVPNAFWPFPFRTDTRHRFRRILHASSVPAWESNCIRNRLIRSSRQQDASGTRSQGAWMGLYVPRRVRASRNGTRDRASLRGHIRGPGKLVGDLAPRWRRDICRSSTT